MNDIHSSTYDVSTIDKETGSFLGLNDCMQLLHLFTIKVCDLPCNMAWNQNISLWEMGRSCYYNKYKSRGKGPFLLKALLDSRHPQENCA